MRSPLKKIFLAFVLIALLPVSFILYEFTSLNENEKIIREIYRNQLDAILFSVNQYSDDLLTSWANKLTPAIVREHESGDLKSDTSSVVATLYETGSVSYLYLSNLAESSVLISTDNPPDSEDTISVGAAKLLKLHEARVQKLLSYEKAGFRKLEPLDTVLYGRFVPVLFVLEKEVRNYRVAMLLIDRILFIQNALGPKMQAIGQGKFVLTVFQGSNREIVYSTEENHPSLSASVDNGVGESPGGPQRKGLWLLPGYYLGISLQEATLDDLVHDRVKTSLIVLSLLMVILLVSLVFLFRILQHELSLSQAKSEFVSNVSHEIRTPLSVISMYAETLEMGRVDENRKKEYYAIITKEAARLSGIVNRILNFSRVEANKKKYEHRLLNLNELTQDVLESYAVHLKENGFTLETYFADPLPGLDGDRESILEVIVNLLDNGMKYSRDKKHIIIRTGIEKDKVFLSVKDEGIGIPRAYQQEIFEPFYRAPMGNVHNTKGSGLGLALVKKTMEAHRGSVKVDSALDKGSTFTLYFPALTPTV